MKIINPLMVSLGGLRWYKNRVVVNYDMDSKSLLNTTPAEHNDGLRSMLTMSYVASARFILGNSFSELSADQLHDMSRTFPYHTTAQSARPIDAFNEDVKFSRIYYCQISSPDPRM